MHLTGVLVERSWRGMCRLLTLHSLLCQRLHHIDEMLAVILEQVVSDREYSIYSSQHDSSCLDSYL